jgi:hypothetical protein
VTSPKPINTGVGLARVSWVVVDAVSRDEHVFPTEPEALEFYASRAAALEPFKRTTYFTRRA